MPFLKTSLCKHSFIYSSLIPHPSYSFLVLFIHAHPSSSSLVLFAHPSSLSSTLIPNPSFSFHPHSLIIHIPHPYTLIHPYPLIPLYFLIPWFSFIPLSTLRSPSLLVRDPNKKPLFYKNGKFYSTLRCTIVRTMHATRIH